MIQNEHMDSWTKKSWMDELTRNTRLAKDLTSIYADDVIQAVEEKEFNSLEDAIAELSTRVNLTAAETSELKKVVASKTEPEVANAEANILKLAKKDLAEVIRLATTVCDKCSNAPCDCSHTISSVVSRAISKIGIEALAEAYDCMKDDIDTKEEEKEEKKEASDNSVELVKEAGRLKELIDEGNSPTEAMKMMHSEKLATASDDRSEDKAEHKEVSEGLDKLKDKVEKHEKDEATREASSKVQAEKWAEFLAKKGWFQGAEEPTIEGDITSNDPDKLGYKSKEGVHYDRKPMAVPVGEDARPWEQKSFEEAADKTKKEFLPGGTDLELKKKWQRARYMGFVKRIKEGKASEQAQDFISKHIEHHVGDLGMPQDQAAAAAYSEAREKGYKVPEAKK